MYTQGIRKIYFPPAGATTEKAAAVAENAGYRAFAVNGFIYLLAESEGGGWIETPFKESDFSDRGECY